VTQDGVALAFALVACTFALYKLLRGSPRRKRPRR
jgi:hypothetical protein